MNVELTVVTATDRLTMTNLAQLYSHDHSEFEPQELSARGTFDCRWLDPYFGEPGYEAYLIGADGRLSGFALTFHHGTDDNDGAWHLSRFFIVRQHRRQGIAWSAARQLFQRHPGTWTLSYLHGNKPAARLWNTVTGALAVGPVSHVDQYPPACPVAKTRLRFQVPRYDGGAPTSVG